MAKQASTARKARQAPTTPTEPRPHALVPAVPLMPRYEAACRTVAECARIDEAKGILDKATALRAYAKQVRNPELEADAWAIRRRAERRIGELSLALDTAQGARTDKLRSSAGTKLQALKNAGLSKSTAYRCERQAMIPEKNWDQYIALGREQIKRGKSVSERNLLHRVAPFLADLYCTPPWSTRALFEHVLIPVLGRDFGSVDDPCCGLGHMSEVLKEYADPVFASDLYDYGYEQDAVIDFLDADSYRRTPDWIIFNPPFKNGLECALRALEVARVGVALICRLYFIQSEERYERLFSIQPPTLMGHFSERIGMYPGLWNPDQGGSLATYTWMVWIKSLEPRPDIFIPPNCRKRLTKPSDLKLADRKFVESVVVEAAE
jgi:hypothetical protein